MKFTNKILKTIIAVFFFPLILFYSWKSKRSEGKPRLFWGPAPIINNKYWSEALKQAGFFSKTVMHSYYSINNKNDFDLYFEDFLPSFLKKSRQLINPLIPYVVFIKCIKDFDIFHIPINGGILGHTPLERFEGFFLRLAQCRIVCLPYGSDAYVYDEIRDLSLRHVLLTSYPAYARESQSIKKNILRWSKYADAIVQGFMVDSFPRWDVLCGNFITIDVDSWKPQKNPSENNGLNGVVKISHTPNHKGCKGTEYLMEAFNKLKGEGYQVELLLIEGKKNSEVRDILQNQSDIHCDQLVIPGYGLSAIEGMAVGLPVMSNLESHEYLDVFRRFSFLNQCPILSTSPESIYQNLKRLITDPFLRSDLGKRGREYVQMFHSYKTAQFLFGSIYKKIWGQEEVDLIALFHPLKSTYAASYLINGEFK